MIKPLPRLLAAATAGITCLALAPAPATAAPVFAEATLEHDGRLSLFVATGCSGLVEPTVSDKTIAENGPAITGSVSLSQSWTKVGDPDDKATAAVSITGSSKVASSGGNPKSAELSFSGKASLAASKPTGFGCTPSGYARLSTELKFTTRTPLIATFTYQHVGSSFAGIYLDPNEGNAYIETGSGGPRSSSTTTMLLPAGTYNGRLWAEIELPNKKTSFSVTGSGKAAISFVVPGSTAAAATGKARTLVTLPAARNCAAHTVTPTLTTKAKKLKKAKKVTFSVNGKKAAALKGKKLKKGAAVPLKAADGTGAKVDVTVNLKNGKKLTSTASYHPCA